MFILHMMQSHPVPYPIGYPSKRKRLETFCPIKNNCATTQVDLMCHFAHVVETDVDKDVPYVPHCPVQLLWPHWIGAKIGHPSDALNATYPPLVLTFHSRPTTMYHDPITNCLSHTLLLVSLPTTDAWQTILSPQTPHAFHAHWERLFKSPINPMLGTIHNKRSAIQHTFFTIHLILGQPIFWIHLCYIPH
jgi:hypothetical protein